MHPKISVIVPVYNAEPYLRRCVDSILSQTFSDFELLLVDDGSKDQSGVICDEFADRDKRITVIHKPNTGVSDTRNRALDLASGEFVIFMDADDYWMTETVLAQLYGVARDNHLDIVRGEYTAVNEVGLEIFSMPVSRRRMKYADRIIGSYEFLEYAVHGEFFLWLSLIRREVIGSLRFEINRVFLEDMQLLAQLMVRPLRCMYRPDIRFYAYRISPISASNCFLPKRVDDILAVSNMLNTLSEDLDDRSLREYFINKSIYLFYLTLSYLSLDEYYAHAKDLISSYAVDNARQHIKQIIFDNHKIKLSPIYYFPAFWGVRILRFRQMLYRMRHFLVKSIKYKNKA